MAWTSPRTWVTSELVTAALLNTHLRDNMIFLLTNVPDLVVASITHTASPYTAAAAVVILGNTSGGDITVNLPTAASNSGAFYYIKNTGTGTLTIDGSGSQTIEGELTQALLQYDCGLIVCDGSNWWLI